MTGICMRDRNENTDTGEGQGETEAEIREIELREMFFVNQNLEETQKLLP